MPSSAPNQRRSNVRRANVTACMRCKSRKQRCDQNLPACLNCEAAGVECVNVDLNGQVTPRSYIHSLEDRVAHLEKQLISHGITDYDSVVGDDAGTGNTPAVPASPLSHSRRMPPATVVSPTSPEHQQTTAMPPFLTAPLHRLATANVPVDPSGENQGLLDGLPYDPQTALPSREVACKLADSYFEHSDFFSPILLRSDVDGELNRVYDAGNDGNGSSNLATSIEHARFRVTLVFAIAARLLNCKDSSFPTSRAEAYYASATRILATHPDLIQKTGLDQLENLALLIQYLFFSSNLASAWYLLGFATRMAIEMGIHRETSCERPEVIVDDDSINRRRWVFWAIYSFERIICHVLNRPCSIPDEAITTPLPSATEDGEASPRRCYAIHLIKHRKLSSEIERTVTQGPAVNGAVLDYGAWRDAMWHRLQEWRASVPRSGRSSQLAPSEIFDGCYHNSMIRLYLPSPHMPAPNDFEYAFLARSAIQAVENYKVSFKEGKLRFYWRTLHHLFRAGTALVQCLNVMMSTSVLGGDIAPSELKNAINTCSAVLWGMVERYHLGRAYRDTFESISAPILSDTGTISPPVAQEPPDLFMDIYVPPDEFGFYSFT